jgi:hypothetical protein
VSLPVRSRPHHLTPVEALWLLLTHIAHHPLLLVLARIIWVHWPCVQRPRKACALHGCFGWLFVAAATQLPSHIICHKRLCSLRYFSCQRLIGPGAPRDGSMAFVHPLHRCCVTRVFDMNCIRCHHRTPACCGTLP